MPLHFHFNWPVALIAFAIVAVAVVLCYKAFTRSSRLFTFWLELLRLAIITLVCLLLLQPEWIISSPPRQEPEVSILWDASASMDTRDAIDKSGQVVSRREYVRNLLEDGFGKSFESNNIVRVAPFSQAPGEGTRQYHTATTDIGAPIDDALQQSDNIRAIILLSDGSHNAEVSPIAAAQKMRSRDVPLYAVPIGSPKPLPDLAITDVLAPTYGIVGEMVQIPYTIKSTLDRDVTTSLILRSKTDGSEKATQIRIPAQSELSDSLVWKIPQKDNNQLELILPVQPGELLDDNNVFEFTLSGREEALNVLLIDSLARWEYRFIRNALYRDPGVRLHTLLIHPDLDDPGEGPGYLTKFPDSLEELSQYDVVFIGDIGLGSKGLSLHQASLLKGLVANQASGIVFLPGYQGNQLQLLESDLTDLIPVTFERLLPQGTTSTEVMSLALTGAGRRSLLTLLADNEEKNDSIWKNLPGFNWYAPVTRAKAGTQVLAVHASRSNAYGRIPLLVTQPYGNGKVLFMGIDSAWRWRKDVEDKYHYRFWGQVARWMSYRRNMAAGERVRLMVTPERPHPGDTVNINAIVSDANGAPLEKGDVYVDITDPDGTVTRQQLQSLESAWGAFSTSFTVTRSGTWTLKCVSMESPDKEVTMPLIAIQETIEKKGLPINAELLAEMATISRGRVVPPEAIDGLISEIRKLPVPPPQEKRVLIWCHPATLILLLLLLTLFWVGRKWNGMI